MLTVRKTDGLDFANGGYRRRPPEWIVIHYTGCHGTPMAIAKSLSRGGENSTHFIVGRDGYDVACVQCLPIKKIAYHVGDGRVAQPDKSRRLSLADLAALPASACRSWRYDIAAKNHLAWKASGCDFTGNSAAIGVDLCTFNVNMPRERACGFGWRFDKDVVDAAAALVARLADDYCIPTSRIIRHGDATGKLCPRPFMPTPFDCVGLNCANHWDDFLRLVDDHSEKKTFIGGYDA